MSQGTHDKASELHERLTGQIAQLVESDQWRQMLTTAAKFHRYSLNNQLLIMMQCPDATRVAGFRRWTELGRHVRKGEHGIGILAPCIYKTKDDETGKDERRVTGFRVAHVFDISQTDGEELPDVRPELLTGEGPVGLWDSLAQIVADEGYSLSRDMPQIVGANGETCWTTRSVVVRPDLEPAAATKTLAHEVAHILCRHGDRDLGVCRGVAEVEAESVAYIVLGGCGLDTAPYTLPYVAGWAGGDLKTVQSTAEKVVSVAGSILDRVLKDETNVVSDAA